MKLSKHFSSEEFACHCGCGYDTVDVRLLKLLEVLRVWADDVVHLNSAARCKQHNNDVGSHESSQHRLGKAADVVVTGKTPKEVFDFMNRHSPYTGGFGVYDTFTHIDSREGKARWDKRS